MIKLNKNIKIGDKINIELAWYSWQVAEARADGEYNVKEIEIKDDEKDAVVLERIDDGKILELDYDNACYLTGEEVENPKKWEILDGTEYQPSKGEEYGANYISEDGEKFGFWYFGRIIRNGNIKDYLSADMIQGKWGYALTLWKKAEPTTG